MMFYLLLISATASIKKITEPEIIWPQKGNHILHFSMTSPKVNNFCRLSLDQASSTSNRASFISFFQVIIVHHPNLTPISTFVTSIPY